MKTAETSQRLAVEEEVMSGDRSHDINSQSILKEKGYEW